MYNLEDENASFFWYDECSIKAFLVMMFIMTFGVFTAVGWNLGWQIRISKMRLLLL